MKGAQCGSQPAAPITVKHASAIGVGWVAARSRQPPSQSSSQLAASSPHDSQAYRCDWGGVGCAIGVGWAVKHAGAIGVGWGAITVKQPARSQQPPSQSSMQVRQPAASLQHHRCGGGVWLAASSPRQPAASIAQASASTLVPLPPLWRASAVVGLRCGGQALVPLPPLWRLPLASLRLYVCIYKVYFLKGPN